MSRWDYKKSNHYHPGNKLLNVNGRRRRSGQNSCLESTLEEVYDTQCVKFEGQVYQFERDGSGSRRIFDNSKMSQLYRETFGRVTWVLPCDRLENEDGAAAISHFNNWRQNLIFSDQGLNQAAFNVYAFCHLRDARDLCKCQRPLSDQEQVPSFQGKFYKGVSTIETPLTTSQVPVIWN